MILKRLKIETGIGNYTNCYIVADEKEKEALVVDPAGEEERIIDTLNLLEVKLKYIYLTHCHADHIGALEGLKEKTGACILIHRKEAENLQNPVVNLCGICGAQNPQISADARVDEADVLHIR